MIFLIFLLFYHFILKKPISSIKLNQAMHGLAYGYSVSQTTVFTTGFVRFAWGSFSQKSQQNILWCANKFKDLAKCLTKVLSPVLFTEQSACLQHFPTPLCKLVFFQNELIACKCNLNKILRLRSFLLLLHSSISSILHYCLKKLPSVKVSI